MLENIIHAIEIALEFLQRSAKLHEIAHRGHEAAKQTLQRTAHATSAADTASAREVTRERPSLPPGKPLGRRRRLKANARANSSRARPTVDERSRALR